MSNQNFLLASMLHQSIIIVVVSIYTKLIKLHSVKGSMATIKDIFLIAAVALFGAYAMVGFNQLNQCNAQVSELNHLCRIQMDELKEIADTTEFRRIIKSIGQRYSLLDFFMTAVACICFGASWYYRNDRR